MSGYEEPYKFPPAGRGISHDAFVTPVGALTVLGAQVCHSVSGNRSSDAGRKGKAPSSPIRADRPDREVGSSGEMLRPVMNRAIFPLEMPM